MLAKLDILRRPGTRQHTLAKLDILITLDSGFPD